MEPTKLENQIGQKLQNREIMPSAAAWDRLDAMLTVAEKPKKNYRWMFIAASFLGIALVATVFFQSQKTIQNEIKNPEIVNTNSLKEVPNNETVATTETPEKIINSKNEDTNIKEKKPIEKNKINKKPSFNSSIKSNQSIAQQGVQKNESTTNQKPEEKPNQTLIAEKTIATPKYMNANALLAEAEGKNNNQKTAIELPKSKYNIDAKSLLSQVDGELELSFRERVIQKVSKTYQAAKVAVSERNNN